MEDNEVFVPLEETIRDIIRNEVLQVMATTNSPEENLKVSHVGKKPGDQVANAVTLSYVKVGPRTKKARDPDSNQRSILTNLDRLQTTPEEKVPAM